MSFLTDDYKRVHSDTHVGKIRKTREECIDDLWEELTNNDYLMINWDNWEELNKKYPGALLVDGKPLENDDFYYGWCSEFTINEKYKSDESFFRSLQGYASQGEFVDETWSFTIKQLDIPE